MTQVATRTRENEIHAAYRVSLKSNQNLVIWQVSSESGKTYNVSLLDGKVAGCQTTTGEECKGFQYRHHCHHCSLAMQKEGERAAAARLQANAYGVKGQLSSASQGFSLMR